MVGDLTHLGVESPRPLSVLWRYFSLSKLLNMLESKALYLSRVDVLLSADPFEGSIPRRFESLAIASEDSDQIAEYERKHGFSPGSLAAMRKTRAQLHRKERENTYISCWNSGRTDSAALWRLYGADVDGAVCIRTTAQRLATQLPAWAYLGKVSYKDYEQDVFRTDNSFSPFFHKRDCFNHEKEVRVLANPVVSPMSRPWDPSSKGIQIPIDLEELIIGIYVSPTSQSWFLDVVRSAVDRFDFSLPVETAPMATAPAF